MKKFQVGDLVKIKSGDSDSSKMFNGKTSKIETIGAGWYTLEIEKERLDSKGGVWEQELTLICKIGETMTTRNRINNLNNGWDKDADDVLQEIGKGYAISATCVPLNPSYISIRKTQSPSVKVGNYISYKLLARFPYTSQCSKITAFKDALLWLLEKSELEKEDKIKELKDKMKEIQEAINNL